MGNVGFVDIEELKKVREELNRDRGIETDPNMYNNYNPNRNKEESAAIEESDEQSSSFAEEPQNYTSEPQADFYEEQENNAQSYEENNYNDITVSDSEDSDVNAENLGVNATIEESEDDENYEFNEKSENGLDLSKFKIEDNEYNTNLEDEEPQEISNFNQSSNKREEESEQQVQTSNEESAEEIDDEDEEDFDVNGFFEELIGEGVDSNFNSNENADKDEELSKDLDTPEVANEIETSSESETSTDYEEESVPENVAEPQTTQNLLEEYANEEQNNVKESVEEKVETSTFVEDDEEKDFDVYDSFAEFEIKGYENNIPESEKISSEKEEDNESINPQLEEDLEETEESSEKEEDEDDGLLNFFGDSEEKTAESEPVEPSEEETETDSGIAVEEPNQQENSEVSEAEQEAEEPLDAEDFEEIAEENSNDEIEEVSVENEIENEVQETEEISETETDEEIEQGIAEETILSNASEKEENEKSEQVEQSVEEDELKEDEYSEDDENLENFDVGAALAAFDEEQQNESTSAEEEIDEEDEEFKVNAALNLKNKEKPFEKISPYKFIDVLQREEFKTSEKLSYLFGKDEKDRLMFMNLKDMFNTAIFGLDEKAVFSHISSMLLSLALKNSVNDVNFVICDSKLSSDYESFDKSSYMFFNRVAKTNREILDTLAELENELEHRYTMLAEVGTKSIDHYNKFASEADISPMPYIIVVFNNYTRASGMILGEQINICLSNLLRLGRLVGIYFVVSAYETIENSAVNLNLSGRIAHQTNSEENSIFEVGTTDATRLEQDDEFVYSSVKGDEIFHLKTAKLTLNEVNLIIENLEK